jgi:hypothetical protein
MGYRARYYKNVAETALTSAVSPRNGMGRPGTKTKKPYEEGALWHPLAASCPCSQAPAWTERFTPTCSRRLLWQNAAVD